MQRVYVCLIAAILAAAAPLCVAQTVHEEKNPSKRETVSLLRDAGLTIDELAESKPDQGHWELILKIFTHSPERLVAGASEEGTAEITVLERLTWAEPLPRQRSFELSGYQLVAVGVTAEGAVRAVRFVPDPRVARAEYMTASEEMRGEFPVMTEAQVSVPLPVDDRIEELRLFSARVENGALTLDLIGTTRIGGAK